MNEFLSFNRIELWHIAGWTMLHYLWLGTLVAAAAVICRLLLRRTSPNIRYAAALCWLMFLAVLPIGVAVWLNQNAVPFQFASAPRLASDGTSGALVDVEEPLANASEAHQGIIELSKSSTELPSRGQFLQENDVAESRMNSAGSPTHSIIGRRALSTTLESCVPYLPWLWIVGTPITFALLAAGVVGTKRLRRASRAIHEPQITEVLARLTGSLRVSRRVAVAVCERIAAPVLVGILRPIILLPPAALTGWTPDEIEMVLLHELAHVRRWDNFVNLVQRIIESLLFFHPAVWFVSAWVRREREACCDALVVTRTNRPHAYAELLVALAAQMPRSVLFHPAASSAMAAGPLRSRIRRILGLHDDPMLISGKSFALVLAGLLVAATLAVLYVPTIGQAEESTTKTTESTDTRQESTLAARGNSKWKNAFIVRSKFVPSSSNVLETRSYRIANSSRAVLDLDSVTAVLSADESEPRPAFGHNWSHDFTRLKVVAPREGQKFIASLIREALADAISEPGETGGVKDSAAAPRTKSPTLEGQKPVGDWPKGVAFPTPKEGEISKRAWQVLGIKVLPASQVEQAQSGHRLKIVGGVPVPTPSPPGSTFLERVGDVEVNDFDELDAAIDQSMGKELVVVRCTTMTNREPVFIEFVANSRTVAARETSPQEPTSTNPARKFPSLEDQKLADLAWKRLQLELEPIGDDDLKRVRALGYDGGVKVVLATADALPQQESVLAHDILVGLHVWPTTSMKEVVEILERDDLAQLNPLKFYVVSNMAAEGKDNDVVRTGRISVAIGGGGFGPGPMMGSQFVPTARLGIDPYAAPAKATPAPDPDLPRYEVPSPEVEAVAPSKSQPANPNPFAAAAPSKRAATNGADMRGAAAGKDNLRYDGKTFDEWRNAWQTELSTEKRIEAVKALAAFGRAGYGKEAAQAILDVVRQYDWQYLEGSSSSVGRLQELTIKAFAGTGEARLPREDALPVLTSAIKAGDKKAIDFAQYVVNYFGEDEQSRARLLELSRDDELKSIRNSVLYRLATIHQLNPDAHIEKRMVEALSEGQDAARTAIVALYPRPNSIFGPSRPAPNERSLEYRPELVELLSRGDAAFRRELLDALGRLKAKARPALPKIYPRLLDDDGEVVERAYFAVHAITGSHQDAIDYLRTVVSEKGPSALMSILLSKNDVAAKLGRQAASTTLDEKSSTTLVEQLLERLTTEPSANLIATIRALAAMGPRARPAWDKLMELLESPHENTRIAAATAIKMIVGKDQYQKPIADVLGKELGIKVVKSSSGEWGALPRDNATDNGQAFNNFNDAVIKEQQELFLPEVTNTKQ